MNVLHTTPTYFPANSKFKKLIAERDLEIETMKEINRRKW